MGEIDKKKKMFVLIEAEKIRNREEFERIRKLLKEK